MKDGFIKVAAGGISVVVADPDANAVSIVEQAAQAAVERALGGVQLTIPINVDGVKLGEAAIRGINQVTKNTGRHLLDI